MTNVRPILERTIGASITGARDLIDLLERELGVDTIAELRAIPINDQLIKHGSTVLVRGSVAAFDRTPRAYKFNPDSVAADDGDAVIAPTPDKSEGRWEAQVSVLAENPTQPTAADEALGTDQIFVSQGGANKRLTLSQVRAFILGEDMHWSFDWQFKIDKTLVDRVAAQAITLTRASANGTHVDSSGVIQTLGTNAARFDHLPAAAVADVVSLGLLLEHATTNLLLHSENLGNVVWAAGSGETYFQNEIAAPDGETTADRLLTAGTSDEQQQNVTATATVSKALSAFFKHFDNQWVQLRLAEQSGSFRRINYPLDVLNGVLGTPYVNTAGPTIQDNGFLSFPDSWYRLWGSGALTAGVTAVGIIVRTTDNGTSEGGVAASGIYDWGLQLEDSTRVTTSYVKTDGATATRAKDIASAAISVPASGTLLIKGRTARGRGTQVALQMDDGTGDERLRVERSGSDDTIHVIVTAAAGTVADLALAAVADDTDFAVAVRYNTNDFAASLNGGALVVDTSGALPTGMDTIRPGMDHASANQMNGTLARVALSTETVSDEKLRSLSGI